MNYRQEIIQFEDIQLLVNQFYDSIRSDSLLGPIFETIIQDRWPQHLEKMYRFWQTVLFEEHTYFGSPFPPHAAMPIGPAHFKRWLEIFNKTVDSLFEGKKAEEAKWRANKMATLFEQKIEYYQQQARQPLV